MVMQIISVCSCTALCVALMSLNVWGAYRATVLPAEEIAKRARKGHLIDSIVCEQACFYLLVTSGINDFLKMIAGESKQEKSIAPVIVCIQSVLSIGVLSLVITSGCNVVSLSLILADFWTLFFLLCSFAYEFATRNTD